MEKALKAFLTRHDVAFRKVHDLEELGKQCPQIDATLGRVTESAAELSVYAARFRYPGAPYLPELEEAQQAIGIAGEVVSAIAHRLSGLPE
ncbi:MAG: HEPN domain-containing protein [Bryobacterales bacterium]|nr:HEPN domain-containing protein [Bryobacterales bacterium]